MQTHVRKGEDAKRNDLAIAIKILDLVGVEPTTSALLMLS
jgi:hypothetical protein